MNVELAIAGLGWLVLAFAHTTLGLRWILPNLTKEGLPSTPVGSRSMTLGMLRFTWNIASLLLLGSGILFITLALAPDADPKTLLLRWFAAFSLAATALACWNARHRPSSLLRLPVPLVLVVIAALSWTATI
jgi:hypothetical protein